MVYDIDNANLSEVTTLYKIERHACDVLLKHLIQAQKPELATAKSDFEVTSILRAWVYENTNFAVSTFQYTEQEHEWQGILERGSAGAQIAPHMEAKVGDMCAHIARLLAKIYNLFEFKAGCAGWEVAGFGHTYTVVWIETEKGEIAQLQDAVYDVALTRNGIPIDLMEAFEGLEKKNSQLLAFTQGQALPRTVLVGETEIDNVTNNKDFYVSQKPSKILGDRLQFKSALKWTDFSQTQEAKAICDELARQGLPRDMVFTLMFVTQGPNNKLHSQMLAFREKVVPRGDVS